jgi:DNA invertase Pin-like site-specific DNA recombinase
MLRFARKDDEVIVHSVDRLARSVRDLHKIIDILSPKGVKITFLKQNLVITGHDSPMTMLIMTLMGAFAEMERAFIRERQQEGIKIARAKKKYRGSSPKLNSDQIVELNKMIELGLSKVKIARHFKCSRQTIYKYLKVKNE